eukprot:TRINITY_DN5237_c0_g1_i2.p3 TRINITY_DN5237_c0_g1~~TRINITY_DN5237_c0_g1_i2.p3  ORF type:complete len:139 (-),score=3.70 TRINITY_DN5237_c0_g1_i2:952-1368(-)
MMFTSLPWSYNPACRLVCLNIEATTAIAHKSASVVRMGLKVTFAPKGNGKDGEDDLECKRSRQHVVAPCTPKRSPDDLIWRNIGPLANEFVAQAGPKVTLGEVVCAKSHAEQDERDQGQDSKGNRSLVDGVDVGNEAG